MLPAREIDVLPSKTVGRRQEGAATADSADILLKTAWALSCVLTPKSESELLGLAQLLGLDPIRWTVYLSCLTHLTSPFELGRADLAEC